MSPALRARNQFVLLGLFLLMPALVLAQGVLPPSGGEYPISGEVNGDQTAPGFAFNSNGGLVAWTDNGIDGKGLGIGARRLDASLNPVGEVFRLNSTVLGDQEKPGVALLNNGGAVVVFQGGRQGFQNIYARFLRADGTFATSDVLVNTPAFSKTLSLTTNWIVFRANHARQRTQRIKQIVNVQHERTAAPAVASLTDGTVVAAYASGRRFTTNAQTLVHQYRWNGFRFITNSLLKFVPVVADPMQDVYFQLLTVEGVKVGGEIRANQKTALNQRNPSLAALSDGTFVVAWSSDQHRGETNIDIVARIFDRNGTPLGDEFVVNTSGSPCGEPSVAAMVGGGFTIAWTQLEGANKLDVFARSFSPSALPITTGFVLNNERRGDQHTPHLASVSGGQLVVWTSMSQDGSREGVYGRWLNDGLIVGDEFRVNTTTHLRQFTPAVAADGAGRALVIWSSYQTMAGFDLFGQRYAAP